MCGHPTRVTQAALVICHDPVAIPAERRQIAGQFAAQVCIRAMMNLNRAEAAVVVTDATPEAGGFQLGEPGRALTPAATRDVLVIVHDLVFRSME